MLHDKALYKFTGNMGGEFSARSTKPDNNNCKKTGCLLFYYNINSVLCIMEDRVVLQSLLNTTKTPQRQFKQWLHLK